MIKSNIKINGKSIAVCKVDYKETILTLLEGQVGKKNKTYHAHGSKNKEDDKDARLKYLLCLLNASKQQFEVALFKAKIKLEEFKKYLNKKNK